MLEIATKVLYVLGRGDKGRLTIGHVNQGHELYEFFTGSIRKTKLYIR